MNADKARSFRRRISRKLSRRRGVEVFDFHSNESIISSAKWIALRPKNLLAVLERFFSRNSAAEIRVSFFLLNSRPFLLPYMTTQFVLASWNSLLCSFGRGGAHLHILSNPASHLSWAFHSSSKISRKNGVRSVRLRLIFAADSLKLREPTDFCVCPQASAIGK